MGMCVCVCVCVCVCGCVLTYIHVLEREFVCVGVTGTMSSLNVIPSRRHAGTPGTGVFRGLLLNGSV